MEWEGFALWVCNLQTRRGNPSSLGFVDNASFMPVMRSVSQLVSTAAGDSGGSNDAPCCPVYL